MAIVLQLRRICNVQNQRVVLRTSLGCEDAANRLRVQGICTQAVDRLRGDAQKTAVSQDFGGLVYVSRGEKLRFQVGPPLSQELVR